jgi:hypothetical protein
MGQAIAKAVEVSTTDSFVIDTTGADDTINPSKTHFGNIWQLAYDINNQIADANIDLIWARSSTAGDLASTPPIFTVVSNTTAGGPTLVDITGTLAVKLGFTGSESVQSGTAGGNSISYIVATYQPEEVFIPTYYSSDQGWFNEDANDVFKGTMGTDGNLSGVNYTARKKRTIEWPAEFATNAIEYADSATAFQRVRSFTYVIHGARSMVLAESGSGNVYTKGVYFIEDLDSVTLQSEYDSGDDVQDNMLFCSCGPPRINGPHMDISKRYFDISLELTTAVAPSTY